MQILMRSSYMHTETHVQKTIIVLPIGAKRFWNNTDVYYEMVLKIFIRTHDTRITNTKLNEIDSCVLIWVIFQRQCWLKVKN